MIKILAAVAAVATAAGIAALADSNEAVAQGGTCFASFDREFGELGQSQPMNPNWGARDTFQWSYFMGEQGINILMKYQSCMDAADFATNYKALEGMRDKGRDGCRQLSVDPGSCTPTYPR